MSQNVETWWLLTVAVVYKNQTVGGSLLRRGPDTSTLWKIIYCMQFLSMCGSMLSSTLSNTAHTVYIEVRPCVK